MNMKLSAALFFCLSALFALHGAEQPKGERNKGKEKDKLNQPITELRYPWKQTKDGSWEYDSGSTQYYAEQTRQQFAKVVLSTSPDSKR